MKQRLFVALDMPQSIQTALADLQPPAHGKLRPIPPGQLHATLHFIGLAEAAAVVAHLDTVVSPPFRVAFTQPGLFRGRGKTALWLGLEKREPLLNLYQAIGDALHPLAASEYNRRFVPHVTLARCRRGCPRRLIDEFLEQPPPPLPTLDVNHFSLYASELTPEGPVYSLQHQFSLEPSGELGNL